MLATVLSMDLATRVLIVDDDEGIRTLISSFLEKHGFRTDVAANPEEMRASLARVRPDLIVLDVMMPGEDGLTALRGLQGGVGGHRAPPVIMLSAVGSDIDRIIGLEIGAADYLPKPCNPRELLARIRAVLRRDERSGGEAATATPLADQRPLLRFAGWALDPAGFMLHDPDGAVVPLTEGEFRLMRALVEHPRRVLSRDQLLDFARGEESDSYDRAIDVQVSRLRRKLSAGRGGGELIRTVRSEGYMFMAAVSRDQISA